MSSRPDLAATAGRALGTLALAVAFSLLAAALVIGAALLLLVIF